MSKKFNKVLIFTAIASAAAATCYFFNQKKIQDSEDDFEDEDFDNFSSDADSARSYVPLNSAEDHHADSTLSEDKTTDSVADGFTPLAKQIAENEKSEQEAVEEFFDEDDDTDDAPLGME